MSSILNVISLPPEWFELLDDELSLCNGACGCVFLCGIEYMGMAARLGPGIASEDDVPATAAMGLLPNVFILGAGMGGGATATIDLESTSGKLDDGEPALDSGN